MKFKLFVKIGTVLASIILVMITFITLSIFALEPEEPIIFTNALLLVLILVQLLVVSTLVSIHDALTDHHKKGGRKK